MGQFKSKGYPNLNQLQGKRPKKIPILRFLIPVIILWYLGSQIPSESDDIHPASDLNQIDSVLANDPLGPAVVNDYAPVSQASRLQIGPEKLDPFDSLGHSMRDSALSVDTLTPVSEVITSANVSLPPSKYAGMQYQKDTTLGRRISIYLDRYQPEGAFVLMVNAQTNEVLAWGQRSQGKLQDSPTYLGRNTFPAASLAKTLTASAALDHNRYANHSKFPKIGNPTKLYKRQLSPQRNYTGPQASMEKAYAKSYNPIFGIIGQGLGKARLLQTAKTLGMEQDFPGSKPQKSNFKIPNDQYGIAEVASGFIETTTLSPLHAAGIFRSLVQGRALQIPWSKHIPSQFIPDRPIALPNPALKPNTYYGMMKMMKATTSVGTARTAFKKNIYSYHRKRLLTGGKTGTIDGGSPQGRYDWFAGFAQDRKDPQQKIIIVVMQHHGKIWTLKSSHVAALLINQWAKHNLK